LKFHRLGRYTGGVVTKKQKLILRGWGYPAYRPLAKPLPKASNTTPATAYKFLFIGII